MDSIGITSKKRKPVDTLKKRKPVVSSKKRKPVVTLKKRIPNLPEINGAAQGELKEKHEFKPLLLDHPLYPFKEEDWNNKHARTFHRSRRAPDPEGNERILRSAFVAAVTRYSTLVKGGKICISSSDFEAFVPPTTAECCFDASWVAVHGLHSVCMVTCRNATDSASFHLPNMLGFSEAVIYQVECIQYKDFGVDDEIVHGKVAKPFAVVSLVLDTEKSWDEAKDPVSNFLYQKMRNSGLAFTDYETIQAAIGAFQQVSRGQELSAKDIWVTSMDVSSGRFDHLDIDRITEQLDIVNNGKSATSPLQSQVSPETLL